MPCDNTFSVLYDHGGLGVGDYRCKAQASAAGSAEESREHSIVFVRRGVFEKHVGKRTTLGIPNSVLFYPKGEVHQTGHPASGGDDCTVFMLDPAILRDVLEPVDPGAGDRPNPFPLESFTLDSSLFLRHWRVFKKLGKGSVDSLAIQEELLDLCAEVLEAFGPVAILYTTYLFEIESAEGEHTTTSGRGTEIFVKREGHWVNPGWHLDSGSRLTAPKTGESLPNLTEAR